MRRVSAWAETVNDGHTLERVHEATEFSDGGAEVETRTVYGGQQGRGLVREAEAPLEVGAPWGWGYGMSGEVLADRGVWMWCWVERGAARRLETDATPLEIGEEAPLEVVSEAPLKLEGER